MPTGTAPVKLTFCTLGPAATIVVSCRIGNTVDMFHSLGSTAWITSAMFCEPSSAASIFCWMLWSQMPVMLLGACTNAPESGAGMGWVDVGVVTGAGAVLVVGFGDGDGATPGTAVETAVASSARQP